MPWSEVSPMDQKRFFIKDWRRQTFTFVELCDRYGISRKSGYKWVARFQEEGLPGLTDRSRRPLTSPNATPVEIEDKIVELRGRHPTWGPKKLLWTLEQRHPDLDWPARSTTADILVRNDLITHHLRRRYPGHGGKPAVSMSEPNQTWSADFKGQFKTTDGIYCYPLTVCDGASRYVLEVKGLDSTKCVLTMPRFERLFKEFGMPKIIRSDNGVPFATNGLGRLSELSVWWIRLGIYPERIQPSHPEQNGRHERMHRTLKRETARPPAASMRAQQRRFDRFRAEYNDERPHEALDGATPSSLYVPSPRAFPSELPEVGYPPHFELRYVSRNGCMRFNKIAVNITHAIIGQYVGLEEVGDGIWDVYYGPMRLGQLDERKGSIEDALGRRARNSRSIHNRPMSPMSLD